ncbi:acyloxyacyl hydrolase [Vibrio sp. E150_011]|uniref:acyloxyacyl hydrolase n=1 Tax=unclassified Vibrio TaxID=2614977 RepID=UPI000C82B9E2|nr:outer membrane beta-barrel protein [Vibrio sp. 10N.286.48.B7]PMH80595.1 hypothetical protein BCU58_03570 [Vibrio sp. 10N.286.48.B7]
MKNIRFISILAMFALLFSGITHAHEENADLKFRGGIGYTSLGGDESAANVTVGLELNQYIGLNFDMYKGADNDLDYTGGGFALELGYNFALSQGFELRPFVEAGMTAGVMENPNTIIPNNNKDAHLGFSSNVGLRLQHDEVPVYTEFKTDLQTSHSDARYLPENTFLVGFRFAL